MSFLNKPSGKITHSDGGFLDNMGEKIGDPMQVDLEENPKAPLLLRPHYSDRRFLQGGQSVYCASDARSLFAQYRDPYCGLPGLTYDYDDRLWQQDADRWREAEAAADRSAPARSAEWLSVALSHYHGRPCRVRHVRAGIRPDNGHSWWAAGWSDEVEVVLGQRVLVVALAKVTFGVVERRERPWIAVRLDSGEEAVFASDGCDRARVSRRLYTR